MKNASIPPRPDTRDRAYTESLLAPETLWWKRVVDLQAPYRWNIRRLNPGFTLDIGCGVGRNLVHLKGQGVGVDHNPHSVAVARSRGLKAFTPKEFERSEFRNPALFDSLLLSHVAEHMSEEEAVALLQRYMPLLKPRGHAIVIAPQEAGYRSDPTHVRFLDFSLLERLVRAAGLAPLKSYSFPLPRVFGGVFKYNEFISISEKS